ncbi:hypothetical protein C8R46DRAFT_1341534 [Mycena filopes]|nr:hypothetical protein C8R46DRAFT_1341534 [Mycena filopes]
MSTFSTLPPDILLRIVADLSLRDVLSLSMVTKSLHKLSEEHAFWYAPLCRTRLTQPIPGPSTTDLAHVSPARLKATALHCLRLAHNWSLPHPRIARPPTALRVGTHTAVLFCLPGTSAVVLYSLAERSVRCVDAQTGILSAPLAVGFVRGAGALLEEADGAVVMPLLVSDTEADRADAVIVLRATATPEPTVSLAWRRELDVGVHRFAGIFMNGALVGVSRGQIGGSMEVQAFNLEDPALETVIVTDRPDDALFDTIVVGDMVYLVVLQSSDAFVYACPPRLLPYAPVDAAQDYTVQRSHIARVPGPGPPEASVNRASARFLRSAPTAPGAHPVSFAHVFATGEPLFHRVEVTFWGTTPATPNFESNGWDLEREREREKARALRPLRTVAVPGIMHMLMRDGFGGEAVGAAASGRTVVLCVVPTPGPPSSAGWGQVEGEADGDGEADEPEEGDNEEGAQRAPRIMLVRYDPDADEGTVRVLRVPSAMREAHLRGRG